jgi:uncharacterized protein YndB with AHSA1/START domain
MTERLQRSVDTLAPRRQYSSEWLNIGTALMDKKPLTLQVSRSIAASAERVYDAWLDPKMAGQFLFATTHGQMVRAEVDARVGGKFLFTDRRDGEDIDHAGTYLELVRPTKIVFTFGVPKFSPNEDRITIDIVPQGAGCIVTLTHEMKPEMAHMKDRSEQGWTTILENLGKAVTS